MLRGLLVAARLYVPDDLASLFVDQGRALGADDVTLYLVDHEQYLLVPLPRQAALIGRRASLEAETAVRYLGVHACGPRTIRPLSTSYADGAMDSAGSRPHRRAHGHGSAPIIAVTLASPRRHLPGKGPAVPLSGWSGPDQLAPNGRT